MGPAQIIIKEWCIALGRPSAGQRLSQRRNDGDDGAGDSCRGAYRHKHQNERISPHAAVLALQPLARIVMFFFGPDDCVHPVAHLLRSKVPKFPAPLATLTPRRHGEVCLSPSRATHATRRSSWQTTREEAAADTA
jgi:hypothetical protein